MQVTNQGRPTYLVSKNKKVRVWHQRFGHASNVRIIRASKLLTSIGNFNKIYDRIKIYSDSKQSESKYESKSDSKHKSGAKVLLVNHNPDNNFDSICTSYIASK